MYIYPLLNTTIVYLFFLNIFYRLVVTTVTLESNENGDVIHMDQIAEKDMAYKRDSHTTYECCGDILTCTVDCITSRGTVRGVRKFVRHTPQKNGTVRKMSAPF